MISIYQGVSAIKAMLWIRTEKEIRYNSFEDQLLIREHDMDPDKKKVALRQISYGLYIVSSEHDKVIGADTVNWLSQASFDPPLIMVAIKADSNLHTATKGSGSFAVNILSSSQKDLAQDFFRPTSAEGSKLNGHSFRKETTGSPILEEVYAYAECKVVGEIALGDHTIFAGEVIEAEHIREDQPLEMTATGWYYGG
jgi:flavin reductase (DIM6/NTAB) family NADH-FMN oxidoreductase RutF|tara:strand:+ start:646 stop:1236 length:591 start_codon:yes stop_codon:yes gene_type:complete